MNETEIQIVTNAIAYSICNWNRTPEEVVTMLTVSEVEKFKFAARQAIEALDEHRASVGNHGIDAPSS